jgi:hypothetical protein
MNIHMTEALATSHIADLHRAAAGNRSGSHRSAAPARDSVRLPRVRHRVGFTLVEAGLRLMAGAAGSYSR